MVRFLLTLVLAVLAGYGLVEARPIIVGPSLSISSPAENASIPGGIVTVAGHVARTVALTLDGAPVLPEENGSFSSTLTLPSGGSILTLTARDRFGRSVTKTRTIYVP